MTGTTAGDDLPPVLGPQNPRVAELRRLIGRRGSRSPEVVVEGPRAVGELLDAGLVPVTVVVPEAAAAEPRTAAVRARLASSVEFIVVRDHVFERLAPSVSPQPMLALIDRPAATIPGHLDAGDLVLVLVDVADPGNVGTLVRVADAVAATAVVVAGGADPWGPKATRAAAGSLFRVPVVSAIEPEPALRALGAAGARIVGTDVDQGRRHDDGILDPVDAPVAIVLGSEPHGLDAALAPFVEAWVHIEMAGNVESLNVAMAGTLLAYEARRAASSGRPTT